MTTPDQLHTIADVERLAGVSRRAIFEALASGDLRAVRDDRFRVRIRRDDLERWIARERCPERETTAG